MLLPQYCVWKNDEARNKMNLVIEIVTSARGLIQQLHHKRKDAESESELFLSESLKNLENNIFSPHISVVVSCDDNLFLQQCALVMHSLIRCKSIVFCSVDNPSKILGLVSTVENKALVFLITPKVNIYFQISCYKNQLKTYYHIIGNF